MKYDQGVPGPNFYLGHKAWPEPHPKSDPKDQKPKMSRQSYLGI